MALCLVALTFALPQTAHAVISSTAFEGVVTNSVTGYPVEGAAVYLINADGFLVGWALTTASGVYGFRTLPVGTYGIEVRAGTYAPYSAYDLNFGGPAVTMNVTLVPYKLAFKGAVTDSLSGDPIPGAYVRVIDQADPDVWFDTPTAADGNYEIYAPAGTYVIEVDAISYAATSVAGVLFDGSTAIPKDFALVQNPLAFEGTITDGVTHLPLAEASISVYDAEGDLVEEAYSQADGTYALYAPAGTYDIEVMAEMYHDASASEVAFDGATVVTKDFALVPPMVTRVGGTDRYLTAEQIARKGWDAFGNKSWTDVTDIVIANGEPGREADPVAAAGLAGVYDAPLLLTKGTALPSATRRVITEIALKNPGVQIHLIGGANVVPDARWNSIKAIKGVSQLKHRVYGDDRYKTSVAIADAIIQAVGADGLNGFILVAGDNPAAFYDGLAASPISYVNQMPMPLVKKGSVPESVARLMARPDLKSLPRFAASGSAYIGSVPAKGAIRMATSSNRYTAAAQIAEFAIGEGMTGEQDVALASSLPDALTGGAFLGHNYGVLLFTDSSKSIHYSPKAFIEDYTGLIIDGWVIGSTSVLPAAQETSFRNQIK